MTGELYCCAISKELGHPFHFPGCLLYWPRQVLRAALCKACELPYPRVIFSSSACLPFVKLGFIEWFYLHAAGSKGPWPERWWYKGDHSLAADAHQHPSVIHSDPYQISQQRDAWIDLQPVANTIECVCVEEWLIRHYTDVSSASQVSEVDWVLEFRYSLSLLAASTVEPDIILMAVHCPKTHVCVVNELWELRVLPRRYSCPATINNTLTSFEEQGQESTKEKQRWGEGYE